VQSVHRQAVSREYGDPFPFSGAWSTTWFAVALAALLSVEALSLFVHGLYDLAVWTTEVFPGLFDCESRRCLCSGQEFSKHVTLRCFEGSHRRFLFQPMQP